MPYGYGSNSYNPSRRFGAPPSYGGETVMAEVLNRINDQLDQRSARKAEEEEQERKDKQMMMRTSAEISMANVGITDAIDKADDKRKTEEIAKKLLANAAKGDRTAAAQLVQMGYSDTAVKYLLPEKEAPSREQISYENRRGALRADKEMGAGAFAPKAPKATQAPAGPPKPMSSTEANRMARSAVQTYMRDGMEVDGQFQRNGSPEAAIIQQVVMDPSYASMTQDPNFIRSIRAEAARVVREQRAQKSKAGTGRGATAGSFAKADSILKATQPR
jgi:uncharacterized protein (DUF2126 family)